MPLLKVDSVTKRFGGLTAVDRVSLKLERGELRGLIGPNGSGKTTLLNLITGVYRLNEGRVFLNEERIDGLMPNQIFAKGIARTFQIPRVFAGMTVIQNLLVPFFARWSQKNREDAVSKALGILDFLSLTPVKDNLANEISGGQRVLLELGRAMMTDPILYLLDEPFAGVNPGIKDAVVETINKLKETSTFVVVSHETSRIADFCSKVTVMSGGEKIAEGSCDEVLRDSRVVEAYLGA